ncbi:MAG TPA: hypothetical protein VFP54_03880 [Acidimicrobiales bacterium]|nr:hypothetical protein [Acidimicrobiales bacterium]
MIGGRLRTVSGRVAGATVLTAAVVAYGAVAGGSTASADPTAPPPFSSLSNCPNESGPALFAKPTDPFVPVEVPFKAIIFGGQITIPPDILIPHLYATACGTVTLPSLAGKITSSDIVLANPNVYINCEPPTATGNCLEDLPTKVSFGDLNANIDLTPAHNGGLDITVTGSTQASVSELGFTCGITVSATFTTKTDGTLSGQPVTGPTEQGQAEVVSNSFAVPAVVGSDSGKCPPSVAQTFNQVLGLPAAAGRGTFTAPFCFDFELEGINKPPATSHCPWPQS